MEPCFYLTPHLQVSLVQALQKLQCLVAKAETSSNEALKAAQAEAARAAQAEAVQYTQTEAVADSLLAFQQTHAAELAKRDAAIAELQSAVGRLQGFLEGQQNPSEGHSQTAKGQQDSSRRQQWAANGEDLKSVGQEDPTSSHAHIDQQEGSQKAADGATKGSVQRKAAIGPLKGKARQSIDGKTSRQGPKTAVKAASNPSSAAASLSKGGPSTPKGIVDTQPKQQQRRPLTELSENEVCFLVKSSLLDDVLLRHDT